MIKVWTSGAEAGRPRLRFQPGYGARQRRRAPARAQHPADQAADGLAIAGIGERRRRLGLDRDDDVDRSIHRASPSGDI